MNDIRIVRKRIWWPPHSAKHHPKTFGSFKKTVPHRFWAVNPNSSSYAPCKLYALSFNEVPRRTLHEDRRIRNPLYKLIRAVRLTPAALSWATMRAPPVPRIWRNQDDWDDWSAAPLCADWATKGVRELAIELAATEVMPIAHRPDMKLRLEISPSRVLPDKAIHGLSPMIWRRSNFLRGGSAD